MKRNFTSGILNRFFPILSLVFIAIQASGQMANGKPKFVGNIVSNYVPASFDTYWNQLTPENSGKWGTVEATRNVMNWADLDKAYNHAMQKGIPFKQHAFVWFSQQPSWLAGLSQAEQAAEVEEWIRLYAQRYPNTQLVDVVNEPLHGVPVYANAIGGSGSTGWDWIVWSFQKARQYLPNAKLLLNDYNVISSSKATSDYINIINILKTRGLIDGIGEQGHGLEYAQSSTLERNLNSLQATGVPIYISELDLESADDATQLSMYKRVFPLLYEHPGVTAVTLWGYLAGEHWKPNAYLLGKIATLGTYTVGTVFRDYSVSGSGKVRVYLTNDNSNNLHDLEVDYAIIDGVTYQAEDMPVNTGVWTGTCGGSFSQLLNCDGYIEFPKANSSIVVRAKGTLGSETMEIRIVDDAIERPALKWLRYEYFGGGGSGGGGVIAEAEGGILGGTTIASTRTGYSATGYVTGFDAAGDYVEVKVNLAAGGTFPLIIRYASDVSMARSVRLNGSVVKKNLSFPASGNFSQVEFNATFVAGVNTIRVYVERGGTGGGDIDYIKVGGASAASVPGAARIATRETLLEPSISKVYPNPSNSSFVIRTQGLEKAGMLSVRITDLQGRVVYDRQLVASPQLIIQTNLPSGVYILQVTDKKQSLLQQKLTIK
jgi:endo-1,4-beta-xylanase